MEESLDCSPTTGKLAEALAKAQGEMKEAEKSGKNHHGTYSEIRDVIQAVKIPLSNNKLAFRQGPKKREYGWVLYSKLIHGPSGEWESSETPLLVPPSSTNMQQFKSAVTYARRIGLLAMLNIAEKDDDGAASSETHTGDREEKSVTPPPVSVGNGGKPSLNKLEAAEKKISFGLKKGQKYGSVSRKDLESGIKWLMDNDKTETTWGREYIDCVTAMFSDVPLHDDEIPF